MAWPVKTFRLVSDRGEPGLYCGKDGLTLGGAPLLQQGDSGFESRPADELNTIFCAAYGVNTDIDAASRYSGLRSVAHALDENDLCRATIISLMLNLPDIDDDGIKRLSAHNISKWHYNDAEPRDGRGRWTTGGAGNSNIKPVQFGSSTSPGAPVSAQPLQSRKPLSGGITNWDYRNPPPGSITVTALDGTAFAAPADADFQAVYAAGKRAASTYGGFTLYEEFAHWGTYDFQRNGNTFIPAYTNASNYAVGVGLNGYGLSREDTIDMAHTYALFMSSNANSTQQAEWWVRGWDDAESGAYTKH